MSFEESWTFNKATADVLTSMLGDPEDIHFVEESFVQWMSDPCQRASQNSLTIMYIAVVLRQRKTLQHLLAEGADSNQNSATGFSVLVAALSHRTSDQDPESIQWTEECLRTISILLAHDANPGKKDVTITPLQAAVLCFPWNPEIYLKIIILLLSHGANSNGVADDDTNVVRIRYHETKPLSQMFGKWNNSPYGRLERSVDTVSKPARSKSQLLELAVQVRGTSAFYDTPFVFSNTIRILLQLDNALKSC
jgi:hypothetical protein